MINLLDENSINRIAESAGAILWRSFVTFGSASAGLLAIFIIIRVVKLVIDTMIHGYALHTVYGWSLHLLGAIWSSVTHLLLHLGGSQRTKPTSPEDDVPAERRSFTEDHALPQNPSVSESARENKATASAPRYSYLDLRKYLKDNNQSDSIV
ncbi:hypothetical protein ALC60_00358 [Trachymyrmex zeteki]|uniref:Uncharacterized protein n=1 Tax=Mycetomoellerius zeteki TaxID=64791 RepID=A0A151XJV8_9HYME|nr:hypothetical protein ALC60_00358 [Trachymyrmex zeteki]